MTGTSAPAGWPVAAHQITVRALSWLEAVSPHFALPSGAWPDRLDVDKDIKPLSEVALAASIAIRERATGSCEARLAPALVDFSWHQLRGGDVLYQLQRHNPAVTHPMELYAPFVRAGYRHPELDELLTHLTSLRAARVIELLPNRALAVLNAARVLGLPIHVDPAELTARTWLGGTPEPWGTDFFTLYAMTHTVFHLTDFGGHPQGLAPPLQEYLHAWLPAWLEVYLEAGQWDLIGELLIVDVCLTQPAYYPHAWDRLAQAQQPDGLVPAGPEAVPQHTGEAVRKHYHPTVVAAIAGTLATSRRLS